MSLRGLMQDDHPLTVQHLLQRVRQFHPDREVITATEEGPRRCSYGELAGRVDRLCAALTRLGVTPGDRVGTLAWNTSVHLEAYLGVPSMGAVLHALNPRFDQQQLRYTVEHAGDRVVLVEAALLEQLQHALTGMPTPPRLVLFDGPARGDAFSYEALLRDSPDRFTYPELDDRAAACLWYTSGTTGQPKGVLGSHRSALLHATVLCMADVFAISRDDRVLPIVPMYHANAWGLPYAAALTGAALVLPGRRLDGARLVELIDAHKVTFATAVPTIWIDIAATLRSRPRGATSLRMAACGGAKPPTSLLRELQALHGITLLQASGMTEACLISVARPPDDVDEEQHWRLRSTTGRIVPLLDARIVGPDGRDLDWDGHSEGELRLRGPWAANSYFGRSEPAERFSGGWLRTGDIARIHPGGFEEITDRAKDLIKSGGEWISSAALETALMEHPDVREAAVIALPDERWGERPLACVAFEPAAAPDLSALQRHLLDRFERWWVPRAFAPLREIPRTSVGKFDKRALRERLANRELEVKTPQPPPRTESSIA